MADFGHILKETRQAKGIPLTAAEEATKIRAKYLSALEENQWDQIPGDVYIRGFLRTYANFLGLDGPALVTEYRERYGPPAVAGGTEPLPPEPAPLRRRTDKSPLYGQPHRGRPEVVRRRGGPSMRTRPAGRPWWPTVMLIAAIGLVLLMFKLVDMAGELRDGPTVDVTPSASPDSGVGAEPGEAVPPPEAGSDSPPGPAAALPTRTEPPPPAPAPTPAPPMIAVSQPAGGVVSVSVSPGPVELTLAWRGRVWVDVVADGTTQNGAGGLTLTAGETRTYTAQREIRINVGNVAELDFTINGEAFGALAQENARRVVITAAAP